MSNDHPSESRLDSELIRFKVIDSINDDQFEASPCKSFLPSASPGARVPINETHARSPQLPFAGMSPTPCHTSHAFSYVAYTSCFRGLFMTAIGSAYSVTNHGLSAMMGPGSEPGPIPPLGG